MAFRPLPLVIKHGLCIARSARNTPRARTLRTTASAHTALTTHCLRAPRIHAHASRRQARRRSRQPPPPLPEPYQPLSPAPLVIHCFWLGGSVVFGKGFAASQRRLIRCQETRRGGGVGSSPPCSVRFPLPDEIARASELPPGYTVRTCHSSVLFFLSYFFWNDLQKALCI